MAARRDEMWEYPQDRTPCLAATWAVREGITREGGFSVLVSCNLRQGGRVLERVDASLRCSPHSRTEFFATWWWWVVSQA